MAAQAPMSEIISISPANGGVLTIQRGAEVANAAPKQIAAYAGHSGDLISSARSSAADQRGDGHLVDVSGKLAPVSNNVLGSRLDERA